MSVGNHRRPLIKDLTEPVVLGTFDVRTSGGTF